ncbi:ArsR/SmtB family transcription factor [Neolewinella antarctica]|uniref:DNA-binding transcriptional ArsR family regulator n=1 Tax=Neolewinella antarctica TaxID=442734 RepID=A0ABX0XEV8_9BACT|nr:metalloregulator ArsR/SmtB family transcription factor [Neolewinella antarctica]NJC27318.1 DNA-binding transcriptional ArsR family regulator [Neolewinella antarctica]
MGLTKTEAYTAEQNQLADLLKALAHPARIAIVQQLLQKQCCVGKEFSAELPLSQPTISRHLRELKDAGIISGTIEGTSVSYCIAGERWREVQGLVHELFEGYWRSTDCCPGE